MTSADITRELRATRPVAPEPLRERVRTIVTAEPPARPSVGARLAALRPRGRRQLLVLVPAAAMTVALAAGVVQLVRPGDRASVAVPATTSDTFRSSAPASSGSDAAAADSAVTGRAGATEAAPAYEKQAAGGAALTAPSPVAPDRAQRTSVRLALETPDTDALAAAAQRAIATTRALGGYVVTSQVGTAETGSAALVVKIPSDRVQDAIARFSSLGSVTAQDVRVDDLQASLDEVNRQTAILRKRIATITAQLEGTGLTSDERASLESTLRSLRDELAGSRRSSQAIRGEAAYATVELSITTERKEEAVPAAPSRIDRALDDVTGILAIEGIVLLYAAVIVLPLALAAAALRLAGRALGRRGRDRLLEAS